MVCESYVKNGKSLKQFKPIDLRACCWKTKVKKGDRTRDDVIRRWNREGTYRPLS